MGTLHALYGNCDIILSLGILLVDWAPSSYCQQHEGCNNVIAILLFPYNSYKATCLPIRLRTEHAHVYTLVHMQMLLIR